jgi:hypothetical protein
MPGDPRLRASDADRERTAELLREHHAVGRLTQEEFAARLESAFAARTRGELDELLADLPAIDLYQLPSASIRPARRGGSGRRAGGELLPWLDSSPWAPWATGTVAVVAVWVIVGLILGGAAWIPWFLLILIPLRLLMMRRGPREP